eukprot:TRINITY_DN76321_c0_g1_i1.p1 TRINITY_DN76321_c0_g1~~TRINITY_DN76321_c0_g1_i1.p1  ORF type:complete len:454 (+),score=98.11 TRINITY_DN76321_c0_g1_i1:31-1392(+)
MDDALEIDEDALGEDCGLSQTFPCQQQLAKNAAVSSPAPLAVAPAPWAPGSQPGGMAKAPEKILQAAEGTGSISSSSPWVGASQASGKLNLTGRSLPSPQGLPDSQQLMASQQLLGEQLGTREHQQEDCPPTSQLLQPPASWSHDQARLTAPAVSEMVDPGCSQRPRSRSRSPQPLLSQAWPPAATLPPLQAQAGSAGSALPATRAESSAERASQLAGARVEQRSWGLPNAPSLESWAEQDDEDEAALAALHRKEGPPGPAGGNLALPGIQITGPQQAHTPRASLSESAAWLRALKALGLPADAFHLGLSPHAGAQDSPNTPTLAAHNLGLVAKSGPGSPQRWQLLVLIRRVELVAGEIEVLLCDPTGEALATVDRRVPHVWPKAICEGSVLHLTDAVAVHALGLKRSSRLLVTLKSLKQSFLASEPFAEAAALLASARQVAASAAACMLTEQ